jgi:hypothetical protein
MAVRSSISAMVDGGMKTNGPDAMHVDAALPGESAGISQFAGPR